MSTADKLTTIAENVPKVYEAGKKAEYDAFWDAYQDNGQRDNYAYAFRGKYWNEKSFKPKYPIVVTGGPVDMFYNFNCDGLHENRNNRIDMSNIEMDFSSATSASSLFMNARVENLFCDLKNATSLYYAFGSPQNGTIENLTIRVSEKCTNYDYTFGFQSALTSLTFTEDSVIAANINVQWSTNLRRESIESIVNALSGTVTGKTLTLSKTAVTNAFGGTDSAEWQELVASKPNWTISLI